MGKKKPTTKPEATPPLDEVEGFFVPYDAHGFMAGRQENEEPEWMKEARAKATAKWQEVAGRRREKKKQIFLVEYSLLGIVGPACAAAEIARSTYHAWRADDEEFDKACKDAEDMAYDILEQEATRRALYGTPKPVYQQGALVGTVREYSNDLMKTLLGARRPHRFRDRVDVTGDGGGPIEHAVTGVLRMPATKTPEEWDAAKSRAKGVKKKPKT